jgi:CubicO group peptidase (beta-lactamase class C family)
MLEQTLDTSWEKLIQKEVFDPLEMTTAGFGAMGKAGKIEQPWQHSALPFLAKLTSMPIEPGPFADNPNAIYPAGAVHCSVRDWARFVIAHLSGKTPNGKPYLSGESLQRLHTPYAGGGYAGGWIVLERDWGGGTVLHHGGSNTMNFALAWVAPKKRFAVLIVTNQAGSDEFEACNKVVERVLEWVLPTAEQSEPADTD